MLRTTVLAFSVLVLAPLVLSNPLQTRSTAPLELVSIIHLEEPCVRQGGICLRTEDCKAGNLVQLRGVVLCPKQSRLGVECCYS